MRSTEALGTRWLGVGLASALAVVTIVLAVTGQLSLYINPASTAFTVVMAILLLVGAVASFLLPLGAEEDHGHDHGAAPAREHAHDAAEQSTRAGTSARGMFSRFGGLLAAVTATGVVAAVVVFPATSLSTELALSRDVGAAPLFGGQEVVTLASSGDTASFEVGDWASVFSTATDPDAFTGTDVTLVGFVTPSDDGSTYRLTRLVITHCVIDAQTASLPIEAEAAASAAVPETGQWVQVTGTVAAAEDGSLRIAADEVTEIDEPDDPYEY